MRPSTKVIWARVFFAFTLISTIVGLLLKQDSDPWRWTMIGVVVLLAISGVVLVTRSSGHHQAIGAMDEICRKYLRDDSFRVEHIDTIAQLRELWRLDEKCYGTQNIPYDVLESWWKAYPSGAHILIKDGRIIGAFGMFPMKTDFFGKMIDGRTLEKEIRPECIVAEKNRKDHGDWYLSGIVLDVKFRRSVAIQHLIARSLSKWMHELGEPKRLRIVAFAYTKEGENLLRRFQFHEYLTSSETMSRFPVYMFESSKLENFRALVNRLATCAEKTPSTAAKQKAKVG